MKNLLEAYGWEEIPSKNKLMQSFVKDNERLNYYFTTGTVTIQGGDNPITIRDIMTEEQMEGLIS